MCRSLHYRNRFQPSAGRSFPLDAATVGRTGKNSTWCSSPEVADALNINDTLYYKNDIHFRKTLPCVVARIFRIVLPSLNRSDWKNKKYLWRRFYFRRNDFAFCVRSGISVKIWFEKWSIPYTRNFMKDKMICENKIDFAVNSWGK